MSKEKVNINQKEALIKSINGSLIIGMIMLLAMWMLFTLLLLVADPIHSFERTVVLFVVSFVTIIPALGLHLFRKKYWLNKYPQLKRKK